MFPFGNDLTNPQFSSHALNVMNAVNLAVNNLDKPDILIPKLTELGQFHAAFELTIKEFQVRLCFERFVNTSLVNGKLVWFRGILC